MLPHKNIHDIVSPPTFTIHALADAVLFEEIHVFVTRKLTSLIRVQDNGFRHLKCLFQCVYDYSGIQCIIKPPSLQYSGYTSQLRLSDTEIPV